MNDQQLTDITPASQPPIDLQGDKAENTSLSGSSQPTQIVFNPVTSDQIHRSPNVSELHVPTSGQPKKKWPLVSKSDPDKLRVVLEYLKQFAPGNAFRSVNEDLAGMFRKPQGKQNFSKIDCFFCNFKHPVKFNTTVHFGKLCLENGDLIELKFDHLVVVTKEGLNIEPSLFECLELNPTWNQDTPNYSNCNTIPSQDTMETYPSMYFQSINHDQSSSLSRCETPFQWLRSIEEDHSFFGIIPRDQCQDLLSKRKISNMSQWLVRLSQKNQNHYVLSFVAPNRDIKHIQICLAPDNQALLRVCPYTRNASQIQANSLDQFVTLLAKQVYNCDFERIENADYSQ